MAAFLHLDALQGGDHQAGTACAGGGGGGGGSKAPVDAHATKTATSSAITKAAGPPPRAGFASGSDTSLTPVIIGFTRLSFFTWA
jgi:hypothetical protein